MNFLSRVEHVLCHDACHMDAMQTTCKTFAVRCRLCGGTPIPDVYHYVRILSRENLFDACDVAQSYYAWTGDDKIPIPFAIVNIEGIVPARIETQPLNRIVESIQILKAMNAPFTKNATLDAPEDIMKGFIAKYLEAIEHSQQNLQPNEQTILTQIIKNFHKLVATKEFKDNQFRLYFEKLVPYVQACRETFSPLPPDNSDESNLVKQLLEQLLRSQAIRQIFGTYSAPFDIFHVLVSCYACCANIDVMANFALDFMARMCRGHFFWKRYNTCPFVEQTLNILGSEVTYKRNTDLYYVVKQIREGDGIECLSENRDKYAQLEKLIKDKIQAPAEVVDMVVQQMFPGVLFECHRHQLAFSLAMNHVTSSIDMKTGQTKKGSFSKARRIYRDMVDIIGMIQEFDQKDPMPWTVDTLKLLLASDANLEQRLTSMVSSVLVEDEQTNPTQSF